MERWRQGTAPKAAAVVAAADIALADMAAADIAVVAELPETGRGTAKVVAGLAAAHISAGRLHLTLNPRS